MVARQLGVSPQSGSSVPTPIEKIVCLEFLAFMLLGLPAKQYCLEDFKLTRTNGPSTNAVSDKKKAAADTSRKKQREDAKLHQGYIPAAEYMQMTLQKDELEIAVFQAQMASRHERTKELQMMIEFFPDRRSYYLEQLEAHINTPAPTLQIIATGKRTSTGPNEENGKRSRPNEEEESKHAETADTTESV